MNVGMLLGFPTHPALRDKFGRVTFDAEKTGLDRLIYGILPRFRPDQNGVEVGVRTDFLENISHGHVGHTSGKVGAHETPVSFASGPQKMPGIFVLGGHVMDFSVSGRGR